MTNCTHSSSYWHTTTWEDDYGNEHCDQEMITESSFEDVDLHRYKCTSCNEIFYYSHAAKQYYEDGILSNVKGLDK